MEVNKANEAADAATREGQGDIKKHIYIAMTLYIRFGDLRRFDNLHRGSNYLQVALTRHSAVKWEIAEGEDGKVREILKNRGFNFEIV